MFRCFPAGHLRWPSIKRPKLIWHALVSGDLHLCSANWHHLRWCPGTVINPGLHYSLLRLLVDYFKVFFIPVDGLFPCVCLGDPVEQGPLHLRKGGRLRYHLAEQGDDNERKPG